MSTGVWIDVNLANAQTISELPGINIVIAKKIVEYRNINGFFKSKEELFKNFNKLQKEKEDLSKKLVIESEKTLKLKEYAEEQQKTWICRYGVSFGLGVKMRMVKAVVMDEAAYSLYKDIYQAHCAWRHARPCPSGW